MSTMQKLRLLAPLSGLLLSACAHMGVRVEILDFAFWASPQYIDSLTIAKIGDMQQAMRDGRFIGQREAWKTVIETELRTMSNKPKPILAPRDVKSVSGGFAKIIDVEFAKAQQKFDEAFAKVREASRESSQTQSDVLLGEAASRFSEGSSTLTALIYTLSGQLRQDLQGKLPEQTVAEVTKKVEQQESEIVQGLIANAGVLDDPLAAAVVYAPDRYWSGQFNQTLCSGSFGNSDCAVKMEGLGNFTIKGVRLDATKITQATFSVARQAIQTAAAIYGIPIPKAQPAGEGTTSAPPPLPDIDSPVKRERDAITKVQQLRLARIAMLETIVAQRQAIKSDNADTRAQAVKTIKEVVKANAALLTPSTK